MSAAPSISIFDVRRSLDPVRLGAWPVSLARRWAMFSDLPSRTQHPLRIAPAERAALACLQPLGEPGIARWHRRRSRAWLTALPNAERRLPSMSIALCQLVLLEREELRALASMCAAAHLSGFVKTCIGREDVSQLRRALGEPAYRFAVHDAQRYLPKPDASFASSATVSVALVASTVASRPSVQQICAAAEHAGWMLIRAGLDGALENEPFGEKGADVISKSAAGDASGSGAIRRRFGEKLPPDLAAPYAWQTMPPATEAFTQVSKLIHYLGFPWLSSFNELQ